MIAIIGFLVRALLITWATLAIYYSNLPWAWARLGLAAAFALFAIWALWFSRRRRSMSAAAAVLFALFGFVLIPALGGDSAEVSALFGHFAVGPIGYFGALGIAFLIAVLTALTSRLTVYRYLADSD